MLEDNRIRIQKLSGLEVWLFIIGRVLVGFGAGVLAVVYFPAVFSRLGLPVLIVGLVLLAVASRGLFRKAG